MAIIRREVEVTFRFILGEGPADPREAAVLEHLLGVAQAMKSGRVDAFAPYVPALNGACQFCRTIKPVGQSLTKHERACPKNPDQVPTPIQRAMDRRKLNGVA